MKRLHKLSGLLLIDRLSLSMAQAVSVVLIMMMLLITVEVIIRKSFGISTRVAHEYAGYSLVALSFWGAAHAMKARRHLRVEVLFARLNPKIQSILYKLNLVLALAYVLLLFRASMGLVVASYEKEALSEGLIQIPEYIPEALVPIGLFFFVLQLVAQIVRSFMRNEEL